MRTRHLLAIGFALLAGTGCSTIGDRIQPGTYALMATARIAEAEKNYWAAQRNYGALKDLEVVGVLDTVRIAREEAGARGFSFQLECSGDKYVFTAKSGSPGERSFSVDQSGMIRTLPPATGTR